MICLFYEDFLFCLSFSQNIFVLINEMSKGVPLTWCIMIESTMVWCLMVTLPFTT